MTDDDLRWPLDASLEYRLRTLFQGRALESDRLNPNKKTVDPDGKQDDNALELLRLEARCRMVRKCYDRRVGDRGQPDYRESSINGSFTAGATRISTCTLQQRF